MSKKITELPAASALDDTDLLTGVDISEPAATQNVKITKAALLQDQATQAALDTHKTSADHDGRYYTETETDSLLAGKEPVITPKGSAFNADYGTGAGETCEGNDPRLSDARTPTSHAAGHASGAGDPITVTGTAGNAVVIAADQSLEDGGTPPGGSGSTNITIDQTGPDDIIVESSSGTNGTILPATQSAPGGLTGPDKKKLDDLNLYPARTDVTGSSSTWNTVLDGSSYNYQTQNAVNLDTWTASIPAGGNDATQEHTASIDFLAPASGSFTMTIPVSWNLMSGASPLTLNAGDPTATVILRNLADGTTQLYMSEAA